ncbi:GNAT family N-acetyltransferase [Blastococcus sp. KM273128]|nr:GNAT family N-acetyltransferase [Blastococcus sp. KM273128]
MRVQGSLGVVWAALAASQSADGDDLGWTGWAWAVLAVLYLGLALASWRRLRREEARLGELVGVDLVPVTEAVLARLVAAALDGADVHEVVPRAAPGERWSPEQVERLRAFHRERRAGLDGPGREATWAVVEVAEDEDRVVGGARLRKAGEPGVLEAGLWLVRDARGRGIGRAAAEVLLQRAAEAGASRVRAAAEGSGALEFLRGVGFVTVADGERVVAERRVPDRT